MPKNWDPAEAAEAIKQVYRRVLEREVDNSGLISWAGLLDRGEKTLREVIRLIGKSEEYRSRFILPLPLKQAARLLYLHFLAREPESQQVVDGWANVIAESGFKAAIDGFIDSAEYRRRFGDDRVPG
ncbi:MAG TPA: phycobilisome rod-core linker polypeptide [Blastocatellia bacterium]|nr:phycobilisome rod-core linker polypeptide [Blastocatellia bacterium]